MAESDEYNYLYEEIDISGDLIPCEFCGDLFPMSIIIEHSSGCDTTIFAGTGEPDPEPEVLVKAAVKLPVLPKPPTDLPKWGEKVLFPKGDNYSSSVKIEQLVRNEVYDIKLKDSGGSIMKKLSSIQSAQMTSISNENNNNNNEDPQSSYIHFKTDVHDQGESDSDDEDEPSNAPPGQHQEKRQLHFSCGEKNEAKSFSSGNSGSTQGLDAVDVVELSDDNNEENETIESFLLRASLELNKIKLRNERSKAKWKEAQFSSYDDDEAAAYRQLRSRNVWYQDCY